MKKYSWIKINAIKYDKSIKWISDQAGYSYNTFLKIINGFRNAPEGFTGKVKQVFEELKNH